MERKFFIVSKCTKTDYRFIQSLIVNFFNMTASGSSLGNKFSLSYLENSDLRIIFEAEKSPIKKVYKDLDKGIEECDEILFLYDDKSDLELLTISMNDDKIFYPIPTIKFTEEEK